MIDDLASRLDGQVLAVAAVHPGSELAAALQAPDPYGVAGRVVTAEADPGMSAASGAGLARELRPGLPGCSSAVDLRHCIVLDQGCFNLSGEAEGAGGQRS